MLQAFLDWHRATLLYKCAGLTGEQLARRAIPPSELSLLGLVRHMTKVERAWLGVSVQEVTPEVARSIGMEERKGALVAEVVKGGPAEQAGLRQGDVVVAYGDKETADALKPWYMFMCKRPCFDNDYLPTYNRPNVHLVDTKGKGITEITEPGLVFEGKQYELDVLIYATGFEVQKTGIYNEIRGAHGIELNDKYKDGIRTLLGIHSQGYPNLFIMGGYQASFQFNLTDMLQAQGDHIAACIDYTRRHGYRSIDVTPEAEEWWVQEVIEHRGKTGR